MGSILVGVSKGAETQKMGFAILSLRFAHWPRPSTPGHCTLATTFQRAQQVPRSCTPWMVFPQTLTEGRLGNFCTFCSLRIFIFRPDRKKASFFALRRFCLAGSAFTPPYDFRPRTASPTKKTTKTIPPIPPKAAPGIAAKSRAF